MAPKIVLRLTSQSCFRRIHRRATDCTQENRAVEPHTPKKVLPAGRLDGLPEVREIHLREDPRQQDDRHGDPQDEPNDLFGEDGHHSHINNPDCAPESGLDGRRSVGACTAGCTPEQPGEQRLHRPERHARGDRPTGPPRRRRGTGRSCSGCEFRVARVHQQLIEPAPRRDVVVREVAIEEVAAASSGSPGEWIRNLPPGFRTLRIWHEMSRACSRPFMCSITLIMTTSRTCGRGPAAAGPWHTRRSAPFCRSDSASPGFGSTAWYSSLLSEAQLGELAPARARSPGRGCRARRRRRRGFARTPVG